MQKRNNAVVDTGVLISAFIFGGIPMVAVQKTFKEMNICVSTQLLNEYREVPRELYSRRKISDVQLKSFLSGIASFVSRAKVVQPTVRFDVCRDKEDNMLLECCFTAGAKYLITGDKDLLTITELPFKLEIVTPRIFVNI